MVPITHSTCARLAQHLPYTDTVPVVSPFQELLDRTPVSEHEGEYDGIATRWFAYGDPTAPALTFVHGFRGDHHGLETIAAHLPGFRVLIPDLPGFGGSAAPEADSGIEAYADWLRAFTAAEAPGRPVVGHSFGSIVTAHAAAQGLGAQAIVLINPIGAPALEGPKRAATLAAIGYYRLSAALPEALGEQLLAAPPIVRSMSMFMAKSRERGMRRWIHDQHDRHFSTFADRQSLLGAFRASVSHDVSQYAADIDVPTLLIAADRDDITPIGRQHELRGMFTDAQLTVLRGTGHLVHYEQPAEAAGAIRRWLRARAL